MNSLGTFPFGQPVKPVVQTDRSPKRVFVLGVYASAVHARWIKADGKTAVTALAMASEPYIFWRGEGADKIIQQVDIPRELGTLVPAKQEFNGPSGVALDTLILNPLGLDRTNTWLCDLVPYSCVNPSQKKAIEREYVPIAHKYGLSDHTVLPVPRQLSDEARRKEILDELVESEAETLILLGDKPIQWFLNYLDPRWNKLSDFNLDDQSYGQLHAAHIGGKDLMVLPLAHPRQIARLGQSSTYWYEAHRKWIERSSKGIADHICLV